MNICPLCATEHAQFVPLPGDYQQQYRVSGCPYPLERFETLNVCGYACPACGGTDRDRLMGLYFLRFWVEEGLAEPARVLEIAPSRALGAMLQEYAGEYRSADLGSPLAMDRVDITDMAIYPDGRFDLVFCSHVLEHVRDDGAALREIGRVLAPGGAAVLLVPLPLDLRQTDELLPGEAMPTDAERIRRFGQADHVRMYARQDFEARIQGAGLVLETFSQGEFIDDSLDTFGLSETTCLYVARRPV